MNNKGATSLEVIFMIVSAVGAAAAYAHMTFITYREVAPRLDRIEHKIDSVLEGNLSGQ